MEESKKFKNLPIIGRIQHGEKVLVNGKQRTKEYGYFIAKIQEENMKPYLEKFNKMFKQVKSLDIKLVGDRPLSVKQERYNQGGAACYCLKNQTVGRQKVKNLWQPIECKSDCSYRQKDENGKSLCNRIAWLKFIIPQISNDRIWLMKITGQQSIDNLDGYIEFQKSQGNSLNNLYTIFLQQKEQTNFNGNTFNNYILDIILKEEFISKKSIPEPTENQQENTTLKSNETATSSAEKITPIEPEKNTAKAKTEEVTKKSTKSKDTTKNVIKGNKTTKEVENKDKQKEIIDEYADCYVLLNTQIQNLIINGKPKEYLVGEFTDMNDQISNIYIHPNFKDELLECELGSVMKLQLQEAQNKKFATNIEFVEKHIKKIAA